MNLLLKQGVLHGRQPRYRPAWAWTAFTLVGSGRLAGAKRSAALSIGQDSAEKRTPSGKDRGSTCAHGPLHRPFFRLRTLWSFWARVECRAQGSDCEALCGSQRSSRIASGTRYLPTSPGPRLDKSDAQSARSSRSWAHQHATQSRHRFLGCKRTR